MLSSVHIGYIGYLSLDGRVGPRSPRQYFTTVSRYHEDTCFQTPTNTALVSRLLKAYAAHENITRDSQTSIAGMYAGFVRRVVQLGLIT